MASSKLRVFLALSLMILLPFTAFIPASTPQSFIQSRGVPIPGTTSYYSDDFTNTIYRDGGATTTSGWGNGTLTSTRSYTVNLLNFISTPSPVSSVDVQGRKLYANQHVTTTGNGVSIYNITDPSNPELLDDRYATSHCRVGLTDGHIHYLARDDLGGGPWLGIYNVSNPYLIPAPEASFLLTDGNITDLEIQGHYLYVVSAGAAALDWIVYDVEDPSMPTQLGSLAWGDLYGFAIDGQVGYFADGNLGLYTRNVSNPSSTTHLDSWNTPGFCADVIVEGKLAYVADGPAGVHVFNVSDPDDLQLLGSYDTIGWARRLVLQGNTLFVADSAGGVTILDVADPTHPSLVQVVTTPFAWDVDLYAGDVVVGTDNGILILQIGGGMAPLVHYTSDNPIFEIWDMRVRGNYAYIAAGANGFMTIDISDPMNPIFLGNHSIPGPVFYRKIDIQGHLAYIANYFTPGIVVYDISDPTNPALVSTGGGSQATDIFVHGEMVFVAAGTFGVQILNYSNPFVPMVYSSIPSSGNETALWVQGHYLYVVSDLGGGGTGINIYDITNLAVPVLTDYHNIISTQYDIYVDGFFAAVANGQFVYVLNVTNPYNTAYGVGAQYSYIQNATDWWCLGTWSFGSYTLLASNQGGVQVINHTDWIHPKIVYHYPSATHATQITAHGDFIYVANRDTLEIFRIFRSAGATYATGDSIATSGNVDSTSEIIYSATLSHTSYVPAGTSISWELSANGGATWESCSPGVQHVFTNQGSQLRWRATFNTPREDISAHLYNITIAYEHTQPPTPPSLDNPGDTAVAGDILITWSASSDPDGSIDHYELQSSSEGGFSIVLATYTTTATSYNVSAPTDGVFFFRVRAVDNDGVYGLWSNIESITITGGIPPPPIPGFPIEAIALGAILALGIGVYYRRRKR